MHRIGLVDRGWLTLDSSRTPMHVGGLMTFAVPEDAPEDFVGQLAVRMRQQTDVAAPWNWRLTGGVRPALSPGWRDDPDFDLDYHLRHSGLPRPGGERELGALVSRLHSHPLDLRRPPWEIHLIEGLSDSRFGIYFKIHHALIDGVSAMRMLLRLTTPTPSDEMPTAPWTLGRHQTGDAEPGRAPGRRGGLARGPRGVAGLVASTLRSATHLVTDLTAHPALLTPGTAPPTVLGSPMNHQRRFATQVVELAAVRAAARATGTTVNDVVLHLCGGALRRFLLESDQLPESSLVAAVPVSLRSSGDDTIGSRITMLAAPLGTHLDDPQARLAHIHEASSRAKERAHSLHAEGQVAQLTATATPVALAQLVPWGGSLLPASFNLGVSNVPGPSGPRYVGGARMLALFPASLLLHGGALNITCVSYDGRLAFGFTGARDVLPHLQRLAVHLGDVAAELATNFPADPAS